MNPIVHFELPYTDKEVAKKFYEDVFGWSFQDFGDKGYMLTRTTEVDEKSAPTTPGAINGGMMNAKDNGGALSPILVMMVTSIDEHVKKIEAAGGKLKVPKMDIEGMGYYAIFTDPSGVVMGIFEAIGQ